ncbi:MAG: PDR/VanB family oxidoreductase, partial [Aquisalimonadaceae bacterium]
IENLASDINTYELVDVDGGVLPAFTAGAHIDVHVPGGYVRQYSLCNDPAERHRYVIGVLNVRDGRGGSSSVHHNIRAGDVLTISEPRNHFPLSQQGQRHLLIAGGIGVTPIISMVEQLCRDNAKFMLYYCTETPERTAFRERLAPFIELGNVVPHHDRGDPAKRLDVRGLLAEYEPGTHLYCCGPAGMTEAVRQASAHWPDGTVHFEHFQAPASPAIDNSETQAEGEFQVRIASSGDVFSVPTDKSILDVLRGAGMDCSSSCEAGICGTCRTRYLDGSPDHRDLILSESEQQEYVLICCSRANGGTLVLDL